MWEGLIRRLDVEVEGSNFLNFSFFVLGLEAFGTHCFVSKMKRWVLFFGLFLLTGGDDSAGLFPNEETLTQLSGKLSRTECWVVGQYLAQKSPHPRKAEDEMGEIGGGHIRDFDCVGALKYWDTALLRSAGNDKRLVSHYA